MGTFSLRQRLIFCLFSGVLVAAALPPWGWWPAAFIGFALFDQLLANQPKLIRFWCGFTLGLVWTATGTLWMVDLSPAGWLVVVGLHASLFGVAALVVPSGAGRRPALVGAFTLAEFVRWSVPFGGVPLATVALGQANGPLAPVVRVGGSLLLVALVVMVGVALSALFDGKKATRGSALTVVVTLGALLFVGSLAALAPRGEVLSTIEVAVVQGGGPQRTRATATGAAVVFANQLAANQQVVTPVDLVLWPENVVNPSPDPGDGSRLASRLYSDEAHQALTAEAQRLNAVLIPGWFHRDPNDPHANLNYSTAVESNGAVVDRYDKVRTVPFGEFVPLRSLIEPLAANMLPARDVRPGQEPAILDTSLGRLGVSVSWEIFFAHRARDAIGNGGQILLNPTNGASYWLTLVQTQQVASSQLRALETGRWVLQAAPTGFSAIINPQGQVLQRTAVSEQAVLHATVELRQGQTWATQVGVWPLLILSVFLILWGHRKPEATPPGAEQ